MNTDAGYEKIKKLIEAKISTSPKFRALFKRIKSGNATFKDTAEYSRLLSELYGKTFSDNVLELESASREEVSTMLLHDTYNSTNEVLGQVQTSLDKKKNINIRPQKAPFPAERVKKFSHSLQDVTVPDSTIKRRARSGTENITMSFQDDYMKENAEFRSKAGLKCYITRKTDGKCCEWCTKAAGRYEFGSQPEDIFRRHDNCNCEIDYDGQKLRGEMNGNSKKWIEVPAEGAGAEPPKVFTKEESAALSEKNKPVVFTKEQAQKLNDEKLKEIFVNKPSIDNSGESGIIKSRSIASRNLPNGLRTAPSHILTETEIESLKKDIASIEADESVFKFNKGHRTGYDDVLDEIRVKGDILPDFSSKHPRDRMSSRAALAHEYYGHRANRGTNVPNGAWNDEFRASYMAAKNCPNLSDEERADLILDALERAKESGVTIKNNDFIRRILYGY